MTRAQVDSGQSLAVRRRLVVYTTWLKPSITVWGVVMSALVIVESAVWRGYLYITNVCRYEELLEL